MTHSSSSWSHKCFDGKTIRSIIYYLSTAKLIIFFRLPIPLVIVVTSNGRIKLVKFGNHICVLTLCLRRYLVFSIFSSLCLLGMLLLKFEFYENSIAFLITLPQRLIICIEKEPCLICSCKGECIKVKLKAFLHYGKNQNNSIIFLLQNFSSI